MGKRRSDDDTDEDERKRKRKKKQKERKKNGKKEEEAGKRDLCEVYFRPDGTHEILNRALTVVDDDLILEAVRTRGLDKKMFEEFLSTTVMRGRRAAVRNPEYGALAAMWYDKSTRRKNQYAGAERDDDKKKKASGYFGEFRNVPGAMRTAIVRRDHPSAHVASSEHHHAHKDGGKHQTS